MSILGHNNSNSSITSQWKRFYTGCFQFLFGSLRFGSCSVLYSCYGVSKKEGEGDVGCT